MAHPIEDTVLLEHHPWVYFIEAPREVVAITSHNFKWVEQHLDRIRMKRKKKGKRGKSAKPVKAKETKHGQEEIQGHIKADRAYCGGAAAMGC